MLRDNSENPEIPTEELLIKYGSLTLDELFSNSDLEIQKIFVKHFRRVLVHSSSQPKAAIIPIYDLQKLEAFERSERKGVIEAVKARSDEMDRDKVDCRESGVDVNSIISRIAITT